MLADLWDNRTRTLLVVASIAVGVFAIGTIANAFAILSEDIDASYAAVNPPNITITTERFGDDFLNSVREMPGVSEAEGRQRLVVSVLLDGGPRESLELVGIKEIPDSKIGLLEPILGTAMPGEHEMLLSADFMSDPGYGVGDVLDIELPDGTMRRLPVVGLVADQSAEQDPTQLTRGTIDHGSLE